MSENQKNNPLISIGTGNARRVTHYLFTLAENRSLGAFTVDATYLIDDKPVVPSEEVVNLYPSTEFTMDIAIVYRKMNTHREKKYQTTKALGYTLPTNICPLCTCLSLHPPGDNCFIHEDNTLQPFVNSGNNELRWSGNHTGHHSSVIEDHNVLTSQVLVFGRCHIEPHYFIGANATSKDRFIMRREALIGLDSLIMKDTAEKVVYHRTLTILMDTTSDQIQI